MVDVWIHISTMTCNTVYNQTPEAHNEVKSLLAL